MAKIAIARPGINNATRRNPDTRGTHNTAEIEKLAYQFFVGRGYEHGHHEEDWLRAENIVKNRKTR